jgi:hypothetical protein
MTFLSTSERSLERRIHPKVSPPLGGLFAPPSINQPCVHSQGRSPFSPASQGADSCSVFVVSHHLDGLLRADGCGLIASHNRPGVRYVSCFQVPMHPEGGSGDPVAVPAARFIPSKDFPSSAAVPRRRGHLPSCRYRPVPSETWPKPRTVQPPPAEAESGRPTPHPEGSEDPEPQRERERACKRKFRCDDAPIRRSGPPRHRARAAKRGRSS